MAKYLLLVEAGHPSGLIDVQETAHAAADMALSGRTVFCSTLDEAVAAIREADPDEVIILGIQSLLMDNASALVTAGERIVFSHSEQAVEQGALAGIVIDDYKLGQMLGMMLIDHLIHGKPITEMPILTDPEPQLRINHSTLERFRNRIPFTIRSLSQAEQILVSIHKSAPTGIGMVKHRVFVQVNDYILDLTGYRREELLGKNARMLILPRKSQILSAKKNTARYRKRAPGRWKPVGGTRTVPSGM
jgi:PAS domain-containing protein